MIKRMIPIIATLLLLSCSADYREYAVNGRWAYFPNQFILSDNLESVTDGDSVVLSQKESLGLEPIGYGSVKKVFHLMPGESYSIYSSGINSASKIWVDGELLTSYGVLGVSESNSTPVIYPFFISFTPSSPRCEIVIEFSNLYKYRPYLYQWMFVGESEVIARYYMKNQNKDFFSIGLLSICFVLFILLVFAKTYTGYNLYMALFALTAVVEVLFCNGSVLSIVLNIFTMDNVRSIIVAGLLLRTSSIILFLYKLYPLEFSNRVSTIIVHSISILTLVSIFYVPELAVTILEAIAIIYIVSRLVLAVIKREIMALSMLLVFVLYFLSFLLDEIIHYFIVLPENLSIQMVIPLIISMFLLIGKTQSNLLKSIEEKRVLSSRIRAVFTRFVPLDILTSLGNLELEDRPPGDNTVIFATMMFIDIRDFTGLSEGLTPEDNFIMVNNFYGVVGKHIDAYGGYIESYGGDGVKAVFTCETDNAFKAAKAISRSVSLGSGIKIGLAIHYGEVILGTIGSSNRIQATAVSNVTRLLTGMDHFESKMGIEILATKEALDCVTSSRIDAFSLGKVILKGEDEAVGLYQIFTEDFTFSHSFKECFSRALTLLDKEQYHEAKGAFKEALSIRAGNNLVKSYIKELDLYFLDQDKRGFVLNLN